MTDERPERSGAPEPQFAQPASAPAQYDEHQQYEDDAFAEPEVEETSEAAMVEVRRTPKYWNFMVIFGVAAAIAITIITYSMPYNSDTATYSRGEVYGFVLVMAVAVGLCIGALVALLAERLSRRSIRLVEAERITGRVKEDQPDA